MRIPWARIATIGGALACLVITVARAGAPPAETVTASCTVTDLTICNHAYCARMPPTAPGLVFTFDFGRHTYTSEALGAGDHAMERFNAVHTEGWKKFEFVIRMPSGTANVSFGATSPALGPVTMTAAAVFAYKENSAMHMIDGMSCRPM